MTNLSIDSSSMKPAGVVTRLTDLCKAPVLLPGPGNPVSVHFARLEISEPAWTSWAALIQDLKHRAVATGIKCPARATSLQIEDDFSTLPFPLPEPGVYEVAIASLAGDSVRGGMFGKTDDGRVLDQARIRKHLEADGFVGSWSLMAALISTPEFMGKAERKTISFPGDADCWTEPNGVKYLPLYIYRPERSTDRMQTGTLLWQLSMARVSYDFVGDTRQVAFKRL